MKHILLCTLLVCSFFAFAESPKREFRATWFTTVWAIDWPSSKNASTQKTEMTTIFDKLVAANMNAALFQVRGMADAMWDSKYEPWSTQLTGTRGQDPGYDPLQYAIDEAHKRGLELHVWLNPYRYESTLNTNGSSDGIRMNHPDWLIEYPGSNPTAAIFDPGNPEVQQYLLDIIQEIVDNYDIDGVVFDDYFYPSAMEDDDDIISQNKYKSSSQSLNDWRRANVNTAMEAVYDMIQARKPWVRFGISPAGVWSTSTTAANKYGVTLPSGLTGQNTYDALCCDALAWMKGGYVDYVSPQIYWTTTTSGHSYTMLSEWWNGVAKKFSDQLPGNQKVHLLASHTTSSYPGHAEMGKQIDCDRNDNQMNAPGSIFYNTNQFISSGLPTYLPANKFTQKSLPPAMDWKSATTLVAPTGVSLSGSRLSWNHGSAERFTVYAYTKGADVNTAIASSSNLVAVVYGKELDVSSVSGYASKTFAVCAYDRYGNEYAPGLYNAAVVEPAISVSQSSVSVSGKVNQSPAPYVDVTVSADYLSSAISVSLTGSGFSVSKVSGWSDLLGGTLRITLNTSLAAKTYSGTITVQSGSVSKKITVTATVNPLQPAIMLGSSSVSLSAKQNATAPTKTITVTGEELSSAIEVTSSNPTVISVEKLSGWNNLTGGSIRITLNTSAAVKTYTETITVKSGSVNKPINVTATINALQPTITVGTSTVSITGKQNAAVAPYKDVTITAEDLSSNLSVAASSDLVTLEKRSGWNNLTGGTLRISLNTAKALGGHSCTVTVKSGSVEKQITVNATINNIEPKLTSSTTSVSLYGEEEGTDPYQDVTITGIDLESDITITRSSSLGSAVTTKTQSGWNARTGGTLRITLDTNKSIKTYSGTITLTSGSASVVITVNAELAQEGRSARILTSSPAISFMTQEGTSPAPYIDIVVTGKNLNSSSKITVSETMDVISCETLSGWSNRRGGTLRITIDPSLAPDTYTGIITLEAAKSNYWGGGTTVQATAAIEVKIVITELNASVIASTSSISLSAEQNETAPYKDVLISADGTIADLMIETSANLPITVEPQGDWDARMGGTLRVSLDTEQIVGNYAGTITVKSGSKSAEIVVDAVITPVTPKEGDIDFDSKALWTQTPSTLSCLSTGSRNRSMAYYNGQLYISDIEANVSAFYHVVDAATGTFVKTVTLSTKDFCQHNLRITSDGQMLFGNTGSGSASITVRSCSGSTLSELNSSIAIAGRSDYFYPYGDWNESGFLLALANTGALVKIPYTNGSLGTVTTLNAITLEPDPNDGKAPRSAKAIPSSATAFYSTATYNIPVKYSIANSQILEEFGSEKPAKVGASGLGLFSIHGHNYMITPADSLGGFDIFDITNGLTSATRVITPVPALGSTDNAAMTIDFCTHVSGNDVYIYQLVPNNGLRAYKFTFTPDALITFVDEVSSDVVICPTFDGVSVSFLGEQEVSVYSVNGTLVDTRIATGEYACPLGSGVYIIRVGNYVQKIVK